MTQQLINQLINESKGQITCISIICLRGVHKIVVRTPCTISFQKFNMEILCACTSARAPLRVHLCACTSARAPLCRAGQRVGLLKGGVGLYNNWQPSFPKPPPC